MCRKRYLQLPDRSKALLSTSSKDTDFVIAADFSTGGQVVRTFKHTDLVDKTVQVELTRPGPHEFFVEAAFTGEKTATVKLEFGVEDGNGQPIREPFLCTLAGRRQSPTKPQVREAEVDYFMQKPQSGGGS